MGDSEEDWIFSLWPGVRKTSSPLRIVSKKEICNMLEFHPKKRGDSISFLFIFFLAVCTVAVFDEFCS